MADKHSLASVFKLQKGTVEALRRQHGDITWPCQDQFCVKCDQIVTPKYKKSLANGKNFVCPHCKTGFHTCPDGSYSTVSPDKCERCAQYEAKARKAFEGHTCANGKMMPTPIGECARCSGVAKANGYDVTKIGDVFEYTLEPRFVERNPAVTDAKVTWKPEKKKKVMQETTEGAEAEGTL